MAQSSFPFENVDTTETQFSQMFRTLNAGVNGTPAGTELKVTAGTGLQVSVAAGQAMVRGHYYISTATELLTISTANATNPRIDTVVLRLDPVANTILLAVVAGTPAASPVAPTLTQTDAGVFEFPLANVAVAANAGAVGTITDRRVFMGKRLQSVGTSAARDIVFPAPVQGDMVWRDDLGALETYYALYNSSTNPGGRDSAGWYAVDRSTLGIPVKATTVTVASGSATANALGVTISGATSVTLDGFVKDNSKVYKVVVSGSATTNTALLLKLVNAGTVVSSGYFGSSTYVAYNSAVSTDNQKNNAANAFLGYSGPNGSIHEISMRNTGTGSMYNLNAYAVDYAAATTGGYNNTTFSNASGIYIQSQSGTFSGTINIYEMAR